jgi:hypothetical protein
MERAWNMPFVLARLTLGLFWLANYPCRPASIQVTTNSEARGPAPERGDVAQHCTSPENVNLTYETGSPKFLPELQAQLKRLATQLAASRDIHMKVGGVTENVGAADRNIQLSHKRADNVMAALTVLVTRMEYPQAVETHRDRDPPVFGEEVRDNIVTDFSTRVRSYFELRSEMEKGLPARTVTDESAEIWKAVRALANRIRAVRAEAKQGDIFTPTISVAFRKILLLEMNANTWATIMDDNPGEFSVEINSSYPNGKPLSTVPPSIQAVLPKLPEDIQYRFLGRHLILYDARASLILDRIPYAIRCGNCKSIRPR